MMKNFTLGGVALVLFVGCAAKAPESRISSIGGDVPERWAATGEAQAGIDTNWVSRIGGARVSSLVDEALSVNSDIRVAAERVNRAVAAAKTAGAAMKPQVLAGLEGSRAKQNSAGTPFSFGGGVSSARFNNFGANIGVSWEADIWGYNRAGQSALISEAQAEDQAYQAARASLAAQVVRVWLAVAEANEQIALAQNAIKLREQTISIVRDRFNSALTEEGGSAAQYRLAESELETSKANLAQREGEREQAVRQLELLMGRYPAGAIKSADRLPKVPTMPPAGLPSELLLRRPDILEAERRFAASGKRTDQGRLAFYPSLTLTASRGRTTGSLRRLFDSEFGVWAIAGSLSQPIWAGGALRSEYSRLKSEDRAALANLQGTVLRAFGEVEQALVADSFLARQEAAISKALKSATEATNAAEVNYAGGSGDALTFVTAQGNQIQLASQVMSLRRLRLDNRITLHLALGGDYRVGK